ncbi:TetR/AcrR family transcriptional regulator [Brevibacterium spongiae]|uniref:TetR family transcriptional regulator n=1 Tax=Brevibacterium spongiae TaxID=2909672 RepID=A0ABY5SQ43_9MICO|nr:TetR/AcrR family transcriptional regulator [Brevibacterium spongiae]UVI34834.1 TetR family transcriptional regulator [Brevibacterium spongiae]
MARKNAAVRREEILAATVEEIDASGLRALRVSDVAARLGLSASLVIYHFETKEALVSAAFDYAGRQDIEHSREIAAGRVRNSAAERAWDGAAGMDGASPLSPARNRLRDVVGWYMPSGSSRSWKIWIDAWSAGLFDEAVSSTYAALDREWKSVLRGLMDEAIAAGECRTPTGGTEACATRILAYLDGLAIQVMVNPSAVDTAVLATWVDDFLSHELG